MAAVAPDRSIIEAFGGDPSALQPLTGGQGKAWRAGAIVLKPTTEDPLRVAWLGNVLAEVQDSERFRLSRPIEARHGGWVVGGWLATEWVAGYPLSRDWDRVLDAADGLHEALARIPLAAPPAVDSPWSHGDRVAWGEETVPAAVGTIAPDLVVVAARPWLGRDPQLIHGDLAGNVVFHDDPDVPVGIIDMSPYFRPPDFATAVCVADAIAWHGAPVGLALHFATTRSRGDELLARAVLYRLVATHHHYPGNVHRLAADRTAYQPVIDSLHL